MTTRRFAVLPAGLTRGGERLGLSDASHVCIERVEALMADGEYGAAADAIRVFAESADSELWATKTAALNVVTRAGLVDLAGRMGDWLAVAAAVA